MGDLVHFSSLFLLTGLAVFFLALPKGYAQELNLLKPLSAKPAEDFRIYSNYSPKPLSSTEKNNENKSIYSNGYFINLKYKIKKDFYFLVGRKVTYTVDPKLYAPPGSHEFNPGLTLNRTPSLGQFGFIIRY